jgi:glutamate transport system permease protein
VDFLSRFFNEVLSDPSFNVLDAFWWNIKLTLWAGLLALVLGTILTAMRISPISSLRLASTVFTNVFRDIPLTVVMLAMTLIVWQSLDVEFSRNLVTNAYILAIIGLGFYHAAFIAEALRSGVNTVPLGQAEAARAIGLNFVQSARLIILPQAFRGAVAPIGNTIIALIKNTTVASAAGFSLETSAVMNSMIDRYGAFVILIFLTFALGYVVIVIPVGLLTTWASRKLAVKR